MWERGLKQMEFEGPSQTVDVAPHVGAWIETIHGIRNRGGAMEALPMWERGLKHVTCAWPRHLTRSLPMWERGLKHVTCA